ncbi:MAG: hypothetical protein Q9195_007334 [Heterodermia aff. obscurata]
MPGFRVTSKEEIQQRLQTTMSEDAQEKQMSSEAPVRDLTPSATFEPSVSRPRSPVNFRASDAMDFDFELSMSRPPSPVNVHASDAMDFEYTPSERIPNSASSSEKEKKKTLMDLAQEYLSQVRQNLVEKHPQLKNELKHIESPAPGRTPTAKPKLELREDPKAQLMGLLYGDPTWTAQQLLDESDGSRPKQKAARGTFWDVI